MKNHRDLGWGHVCTVVAVVAVVWAGLLLFTPVKADAAPRFTTGGQAVDRQAAAPCAEAYIAPSSERANQCRANGWTIRVDGPEGRGIIVSPHAVVRYLWLKPCAVEDGSWGTRPCEWNLTGHTGNNIGLSYWISPNQQVHYVWGHPAANGWRAVGSGMADALAEGDLPHATTRRWERCRINGDRLACPNGDRFNHL